MFRFERDKRRTERQSAPTATLEEYMNVYKCHSERRKAAESADQRHSREKMSKVQHSQMESYTPHAGATTKHTRPKKFQKSGGGG